jgi:ribonuclease VapC
MYFNGTTLAALLSDPERAAASAPAIAAAGPRYTSPLAVIEAAMELPDLGEDELTAFLDTHNIELRDMPPGRHLVEGSMSTEGDLKDRLHAACAAYYETDVFVLPSGDAVVLQTEAAPMDTPPAQ